MMTSFELMDTDAGDQHGLITFDQLLEAGFSPKQIRGMVATGALRRLRREVYAVAGAPRSWYQDLNAAILCAGPDAAASHGSATRLWDFKYVADDGLEITVRRAFPSVMQGVRVHRSVVLTEGDTSQREGIRCTSFERTLCDVTTQLSWLQLGSVLDDGLRRGLVTIEALRQCVLRLDSGPNRRLSVVNALLAQRTEGFHPGGSNAELRLLALLAEAGIPTPVQQHRVVVGGRTYFPDFAWPEHKVFLEWYGLPWHIGATAVAHDNARITALSTRGWRPLIFTDESSDGQIVAQTRDLLEQVGCLTAHREA